MHVQALRRERVLTKVIRHSALRLAISNCCSLASSRLVRPNTEVQAPKGQTEKASDLAEARPLSQATNMGGPLHGQGTPLVGCGLLC